jgi:serine/threonine protein kinase
MSQNESERKGSENTNKSDDADTAESFQSPSEPGAAGGDVFLQDLFRRIDKTKNTEPRIPRKLCPKTLLRGTSRLGAGGLGTVYEYWDAGLERSVALKVAKRRVMDSPVRLQRFLREREVTAKLQHPAIPPVYQTGTLADGRPYYLMRLIRGKSLHATLKDLPAEAREDFRQSEEMRRLLDAFMDVCDAVQYAHTTGIVHRDIKPANIMIQPDGQAYLVDWGLAKTEKQQDTLDADAPDTEHNLELTEDGQRLGSPDWMSPEQASGLHHLHGIPTDIYGLGATLYHILTGVAPHAASMASSDESLSVRIARIAENEPTPAKEVNANVPFELSSICRKAMHREYTERFPSARELQEDLRRWQQRELVDAHASDYTVFQKMEHFSSKHQRSIVATLLFFILVTIGSLWAYFQISQSERATKSALDSERQTNEQLFSSLERFADVVMEDEVLSAPELKGLRGKVLEELTRQYEIWAARQDGSPDELMRASRGRVRLAEIEEQTGNRDKARVHADRATALAKKAIAKRDPPMPADSTNLFKAQRALIQLISQSSQNDLPEQLDLARAHALELQESISLTAHPQLSAEQVLDEQARLELLQSDLAFRKSAIFTDSKQRMKWVGTALQHSIRCVELRFALLKMTAGRKVGSDTQQTIDLVIAMRSKALMTHKSFRAKEALVICKQALKLLDKLSQGQPPTPEIKNIRVTLLFNAIMSYRQVTDYDGARLAAKEGLAISQELHKDFPLVIRYRQEIARGYGNLAEVAMVQYLSNKDQSVIPELLINMRIAAETYLKLYEQYSERSNVKEDAVIHYFRLAACLHWAGRDAEALQEFRRCLSLSENPELLEPAHQANAYAVAIGYALIINSENAEQPSEHALVSRLDEVLQVFSPLLDASETYREMFLNDKLFIALQDLDCIKALKAKIKVKKF